MRDPYIQKNGTLKNRLGITSYDELQAYDFNDLKAIPYTDYVW